MYMVFPKQQIEYIEQDHDIASSGVTPISISQPQLVVITLLEQVLSRKRSLNSSFSVPRQIALHFLSQDINCLLAQKALYL